MDLYIGKELEKRYGEYLAGEGIDDRRQGRLVIDLALQSYMANKPSKAAKDLDASFRIHATRQIRLFLFAENDTTSSTICYNYYLLSTKPSALAHIREEHDKVFGRDLSYVPSLINEQQHLINQSPYTIAVLKESMRLFPGASSMRQGQEGVNITDDEGNRYPTRGTMIWILHQAHHRNSK